MSKLKKNQFIKITGIIVLFLIILTGARLLWFNIFNHTEQPYAVDGQLDLRQWTKWNEQTIGLDGDWEFYANTWLIDRENNKQSKESKKEQIKSELIPVPGGWNSYLEQGKTTPYGYGSYRLKIVVDPDQDITYRLRITSIRSASELYANGVLLFKLGNPATSLNAYTAENTPVTVSLRPNQEGVIDLVIQVANFKDPRSGGIVRSMKFGSESQVDKEIHLSVTMQQLVSFVFLIHAIYAIVIYLVGERDKRLLYLSLLALTSIFTTLISSEDKLLNYWFPINYDLSFRLTQLSICMFSFILLKCVEDRILAKWRKWYFVCIGCCFIYGFIVLFAPIAWGVIFQPYFLVLGIVVVTSVIIIMFQIKFNDVYHILLMVLSLLALVNNTIWYGIFLFNGVKILYYPFDLIISTMCLSSVWFRNYFKVSLEARKLNIKLQKANKLKDQFLANTSHELRNPLHGILNISQTVLERESEVLNEKSIKELEMVLSVGRRMSLMLNDLLFAVSLKESTPRLHFSPTSIQSVTTGVIDMLLYMKAGKEIKLVNAIADDFPLVYADENRVTQIVFNLLQNALKYTDAGEISIQAVVREGKAHITIQDTGIGMDFYTLQRVFEPYEQASSERAKLEGGFGLGLGISKQLVELHGGTLEVHSTVGEGSTFTFTLDLAQNREVQTQEVMKLAAVASDLDTNQFLVGNLEEKSDEGSQTNFQEDTAISRILIVDDDVINLKVLEAILSLENYSITSVTSGEQALEYMDQQEWDLVISDVMMPKMSGYTLTRKIRERFTLAELPILLLTARSHPDDIEKGFKSGANDYVTKPVESLELRSRVRALTEVRRSARERLKMESAWLQAQIQPHFLFNTLNAVAALSEIDLDRMRDLLEVFSEFLHDRFKIQNIDQLSNVEDELNIVRSYLYIEAERFGERLHVEWDIDSVPNLQLPLFTIQPLVENAIRHGIMKRVEGGTIMISIQRFPAYTKISVIDDGVGMSEEILMRLQQKRVDTSSGVGLLNTDLRLKRQFGSGLEIRSTLGEGTEVSFVVKN
ncbi:sensor histidine kinase YesM [Paenibacillus turicensis]|uniref:histidine kinase n=1 Tax=Paenibacillus turicensis TaxID=160487 RepID=A0ABS4FMB6_9BACL|nr:ATP-binding protein [Paenibacillus turicensis]MBP1903715.1 sensor histidine kinase YesM [Paenibacillus turicensis]